MEKIVRRGKKSLICFTLLVIFLISFVVVSANPGQDFSISLFEVDRNVDRTYNPGETVNIYVQLTNTGDVAIDAYHLEGTVTITTPSGSTIQTGPGWNTGTINPGSIGLISPDVYWSAPSNAEAGWYSISVVVTSQDTGQSRSATKTSAFQIPQVIQNRKPSAIPALPASPVSINEGESITFKVSCNDEDGNLHHVDWKLNNQYQGHGSSYPISGSSVYNDWSHTFSSAGSYTVEANCYDDADADSLSPATWSVSVTSLPTIEFQPKEPYSSKYIRDKSQKVYFDDDLAKEYSPIFYIEEDAKPAFTRQYYRILELYDGYLLQYLQVYKEQEPRGISIATPLGSIDTKLGEKPHRLDYSLVYIYVDSQGDIRKIGYDAGPPYTYIMPPELYEEIKYDVDIKYDVSIHSDWHRTILINWEAIPTYIKEGNRVKLLIRDVYHTMKIPSQEEIDAAENVEMEISEDWRDLTLYIPLEDDNLKGDYAYPNIGNKGKYFNSLGFDISNTNMVTKGVDDNIEITILKVQKEGDKLNVKIRTEPGSILSLYLTDRTPEKLTIYGFDDGDSSFWRGVSVDSSGLFEEEFDLEEDLIEMPLSETIDATDDNPTIGSFVWAVAHKPALGIGKIKRNQDLHRIPEAITKELQLEKRPTITYNDNSPDKDAASQIEDNPEALAVKNELTEKTILLIGGPLANAETARYQDYFTTKLTNTFPGKNKGVIEVIDNPFGEGKVILLAGSDRWGTKAAVEVFKRLRSLPTEPIFVVGGEVGYSREALPTEIPTQE
ncbi:MAG: hypothetical protein V3U19_10925 [Thermodesulfobacteriota bacterium]